MNEWKSDPVKYHRLSAPFESLDQAQAAGDAFFRELGELREKHKIGNVAVIIRTDVVDVGPGLANSFYGDWQYEELMLAWAMGKAHNDRAHYLAKLIGGKS